MGFCVVCQIKLEKEMVSRMRYMGLCSLYCFYEAIQYGNDSHRSNIVNSIRTWKWYAEDLVPKPEEFNQFSPEIQGCMLPYLMINGNKPDVNTPRDPEFETWMVQEREKLKLLLQATSNKDLN